MMFSGHSMLIITFVVLSILKELQYVVSECPASISTLTEVQQCPKDKDSWNRASKRKRCDLLANDQSCTEDKDSFVYQCLWNLNGSMTFEVCAPNFILLGYCGGINTKTGRIFNMLERDCQAFSEPCPGRFNSSDLFKYQECYKKNIEKCTQQPIKEPCPNQSNGWKIAVYLFSGILATVFLLVLLYVAHKKNSLTSCARKDKDVEKRIDEKESSLSTRDQRKAYSGEKNGSTEDEKFLLSDSNEKQEYSDFENDPHRKEKFSSDQIRVHPDGENLPSDKNKKKNMSTDSKFLTGESGQKDKNDDAKNKDEKGSEKLELALPKETKGMLNIQKRRSTYLDESGDDGAQKAISNPSSLQSLESTDSKELQRSKRSKKNEDFSE